MSTETPSSTKNNILFFSVLVFGLSMHLFLGKLIFDNIKITGIAIGIILVLVLLHFTIGSKLFHKGGVSS